MKALSLFGSAAVVITGVACAQAPLQVPTDSGDVIGQLLSSGVRRWAGLPFAKSPPERFSPPEQPAKWASPLTTKEIKPSCFSQISYPEASRNLTMQIFNTPASIESEDCLYLNVWAPGESTTGKQRPANGWPVLFWIYGGNLQFGHAGFPAYSGENMAKLRDVVVVSANYRTNVFGFSGAAELPREASNAGFWDQRLALSWVQRNIAQFGGDSSRVMIFGESAGGYSVKQLVANPPTPLPFHAAIMESEASGVQGGPRSFARLASVLGCSDKESQLACVRKAPAERIKDEIERRKLVFGPIPDGHTMVQDVRDSIRNAPVPQRVPIILGTNANEGTAFIYTGMAPGNVSVGQIIGGLAGGDGLGEAAVMATTSLYPAAKYPTVASRGAALLTDAGFQCSAAVLAQTFAESGWSVRRYFYSADFPSEYPFPNAGAWHSAEITPVFKTYNPSHTQLDHLSNVMQSIWTGFARNPRAVIANWPELTKTQQPVRVFGTDRDETVSADTLDTRCELIGPMAEVMGI